MANPNVGRGAGRGIGRAGRGRGGNGRGDQGLCGGTRQRDGRGPRVNPAPKAPVKVPTPNK